jgi:hypothetical protein
MVSCLPVIVTVWIFRLVFLEERGMPAGYCYSTRARKGSDVFAWALPYCAQMQPACSITYPEWRGHSLADNLIF